MVHFTKYENNFLNVFFLSIFIFVALTGCEKPKEIELIQPTQETIIESFSEPAKTRLAQTYRISMPLTGRIGRIDLKPGDSVKENQHVAQFDRLPYEQQVQEAQAAIEELQASIKLNEYNEIEKTLSIEVDTVIQATRETIKASQAQVEAEQARSERAKKELTRIEKLRKEENVPQQTLDDAILLSETSFIELRKQEFYLAASKMIMKAIELGPLYIKHWLGRKNLQRDILMKQLLQAQARLERAEHEFRLSVITSPIDGVVLEKYEQGDGALNAGQPLLLLGNLKDLEVVAEVMTQDALRLSVGSKVQFETIKGTIPGTVKQIEPQGFYQTLFSWSRTTKSKSHFKFRKSSRKSKSWVSVTI